jgi:hypothetical protein
VKPQEDFSTMSLQNGTESARTAPPSQETIDAALQKDKTERTADIRAVEAGDMTAATANRRETARAEKRALARKSDGTPANSKDVLRVAEQPATVGTVVAGPAARVLTMPAPAEDWQPQRSEIVMREGDVALAMLLEPDDDAASIEEKLAQLRMAVWQVGHGVKAPPAAPPLVGLHCHECGAPAWASDKDRTAERIAA